MIVYHGSKNKFDKFDYDKVGTHATSEGFGFYFTDSKQIAEGYGFEGFLYTVEFTGKKSLSSAKKTITKAQLRKFLKRLDEMGQFLSNYGDTEYEGFNKVLNEAVNSVYNWADDDVEMICGICNAYGGKEDPLQELYKMFGFDSVVLKADWGKEHTIHIATVHEAYRIIQVEEL